MFKPVLAAICLAAIPTAAIPTVAAATAPGDAAAFIETHIADYSNVDGSKVQGASFGWLGKLFGGNRGGSGSSGGSSGGATDVPAPPIVLIFGAAALAVGARAKMKKRA